jgi:DNA mismatch endonuclease (patch repair protein)
MDKIPKVKRSAIMAAVRSKNTKLENGFWRDVKKLNPKGLARNVVDIFGCPDIVHKNKKLVVFIDSCFWHGCPKHLRMPVSNSSYWLKKIKGNRQRDREVSRRLKSNGWTVLRIWEHSLKKEITRKRIITYLQNSLKTRIGRRNIEKK